jgi:uncharacterized protein YkwD
MIFLTTILLFFSSYTGERTVEAPAAVAAAIPSTVNKELLLKLVNEARTKGVQCGDVWHPPVAPVGWNVQLEAAAYYHSADMKKNDYFSHIESDGSTGNIRIEKQGYIWMAYGENIGFGYTSEKEVVDGWLKSPGHCKNIMSRNFKEMGVARAGDYWTQDFASR